jgi:ethanolamine ammonia-lyase small subunit
MSDPKPVVVANPWLVLRRFTQARIALGRAGISLPTAAQLDFQLAHAQARDAVHLALDAPALAAVFNEAGHDSLLVHSAAADRDIYLQRPDLGRQLDTPSRLLLEQRPRGSGCDLAVVVADGLSALAIAQNATPFLDALWPRLAADNWSIAPIVIASQGRVALGDEVAHLLAARAVLVLIGERPGLSSPDSMGLYLTWAPRPGLNDADRNCISNIRPAGLSCDVAAYKAHYLLSEARRRGLSGVELKDETVARDDALAAPRRNFLLE